MEIRQLALRVLHGRTLADKLEGAPPLTDRAPGPPIAPPAAPGRPRELPLRDPRPRVPFPRESQLDRPEARGVVLHFFANHELLALELIALALLRFPDADPGYRRGLAAILQEEQAHLRLYVERMAEAGVAFGDVPVNAFFWDCLAAAPSVSAFTAGLSLTFEQANLDFAAHYAEAFRAAGDEATARVLDRVLADEIGHVAHGLRWFRRWHLPGRFWEEWVGALPAPLTPARAKGIGFRRAPRRAAGFDDATLDRLEVWSASRGRRPVLHRFDPEVESQVAGLPPTSAGETVAADLDLLPIVFAGRDDAVWVRRAPRVEHLRTLRAAGFELPELITAPDARRWGGFAPWGLSPAVCAVLEPLGGPSWRPEWRRLYSKVFAVGLRRALPEDPRLAPPEDLGEVCGSVEEVRRAIEALGGRPFVCKAPFSTAGRDRRRRFDPTWVERTVAAQGAVVVEPWLDRVLDLSFRVENGEASRWTRFFTSATGQYLGTWLGPVASGLDPGLRRFLYGGGRDPRWIDGVLGAVARALAPELAGFPSGVGVDAMVYRRPDGLRLLPLLELNPRVTMGRVALALRPRLAPGVPARFDLLPPARVRVRPVATERGLLVDGVLPLTDPTTARRWVAVLTVGRGASPDGADQAHCQ